jgi:multidrug efflux system outer membrane protein
LPRGPWWQIFTDPELDGLEALAAANNQDLASALARFDEARATIKIAQAELYPQVPLDVNYTRQRTSANEPDNGRAAGVGRTYNTFTASLQVGWEIDLWGRIRREVENARAQFAASADDLESVKLAVEAEIASDYFAVRTLDSEYSVTERTAGSYRRTLGFIINRRKGGIASDLDVAQAETQLRSAEADLPAIRLERAKLVHAMGTLCGQPATGFNLATRDLPLPDAPPVPVSLPSELLERRPDVAAAEQRVTAANARIGVAQAAFYPRVQFNGLAGFQSLDAATWFDWPSRLWSFGPSLELPLFTGGRNRAQLELARATHQETVANYRQTVLAAFREVEDELAAQVLLKSQIEANVSALKAAQRTLEIADNRYRSGLVTYLEVSSAQRAELTLERTVVLLQGQQLATAVGLIKALGGGWEPAFLSAAAPK